MEGNCRCDSGACLLRGRCRPARERQVPMHGAGACLPLLRAAQTTGSHHPPLFLFHSSPKREIPEGREGDLCQGGLPMSGVHATLRCKLPQLRSSGLPITTHESGHGGRAAGDRPVDVGLWRSCGALHCAGASRRARCTWCEADGRAGKAEQLERYQDSLVESMVVLPKSEVATRTIVRLRVATLVLSG